MDEDPEKVLEQMRPFLQWNVGADRLFKELQHCLAPEIQKSIKQQIKQEGNQVAVETILNQLVIKDDWPSQLYRALLSPSINRPKLAKKLKGAKIEEGVTKKLDQTQLPMDDIDNSVQLGSAKTFGRCSGKTKVKNLPMSFLSRLKENLDIEDGWKLLAVQFGYSSDDVAYIELKNGSPTEHLILHWIQEHPDAVIEDIFVSLNKMEYKSLSTELKEICKNTVNSVDESDLVMDEPPISIPDFNPVQASIDESLMKGEHRSPNISPRMPHKEFTEHMDMPKYTGSYDKDYDTSLSKGSQSESQVNDQSLDLLDFSTNMDETVPLIESPNSLEPPTMSSDSLYDSVASGISKTSQPSEASLYLDCSTDVTKPQMADSGFMESVDVRNLDPVEHSEDPSIRVQNVPFWGSTSNDNDASESTSMFLQDTKDKPTEDVSSKMIDSGFIECIDVRNQNLIEHSNDLEALGEDSSPLGCTNNENVVSRNTFREITKQISEGSTTNSGSGMYMESTDVSISESEGEAFIPIQNYEPSDTLYNEIQISVPENHSARLRSDGCDKSEKESRTGIENDDSGMVLESEEEQTAKLFVENILESAIIQHFESTHPPISFEEMVESALETENPSITFEEMVASALEVPNKDNATAETEADSHVVIKESTLDNKVPISSNPEEESNDFWKASQEPKLLLTSTPSLLESDATITHHDDPITLSEDDNINELPEEEEANIEAIDLISKDVETIEIESEITECLRDQVISEDTNISQSENISEISVLEVALQDTNEQTTEEVPDKISIEASVPAEEQSCDISPSEPSSEPQPEDSKTKVSVPDELQDSSDSVSLSRIIHSVEEAMNLGGFVSDVSISEEIDNLNVAQETSERLSEVSAQDSSTESSSEIQPQMAVIDMKELASFMLRSEVFGPKVEAEDSVSLCTMDLDESVSVSAAELDSSTIPPYIAVPDGKTLIGVPEMGEDAALDLQETRTSSDSLDAIEILGSSSEEKSVGKEENGGVVEEKENNMELSPPTFEFELSLSSGRDSDTIPQDGLSLQEFMANGDQLLLDDKSEKSFAKPRFTYNSYGYIVLGMAMVGSGVFLMHKYWK